MSFKNMRKMEQPKLDVIRFDSADVIATSGMPLFTPDDHEMIIPMNQNSGSNPLSGYNEPNGQ